MSVVIETTIGDITVDLFTDERPVACLNFMKLCKLKYYNYNLFHTIEQGFIAQTGDPTGSGDGGSSIWGVVEGQHKRFFEGETLPKIHHSSAGLLSLVGAGKHLLGSQFFFTLGDNLISLDGQHCVIGEVVEGHETLRKLNEAIVDENFRPYQDIRVTHTVILDDPFADPRGFREPSRSPSPSAERLANGRIAADEDIDDTDGKTMEEIQEILAEREAKARATILEIVGDLPDAEMAPPENVLFVCKLNPVTTDDDLEIIFSRFGRVKCCEVIRDRKTGDSLQYAFVEFENQKACEAAYFKMDNVLIDDRRIHVDFSQSVSRIKWKGKGRGIEGDSKNVDFNNLRDKRGAEADDRKSNNRRDRPRSPKKEQSRREHRISRSRSRSRSRMTSGERRKAREERHREQEKQRRSRSASKTRYKSPYRGDSRREREQRNERPPERRRNDRYSPKKRNDASYEEKRYRSQYRSNQRDREEISPKRNSDRRAHDRSPSRNANGRNRAGSPESSRKRTPERNSRRDESSSEKSRLSSKRKNQDTRKKSKKSRKDSSSSSSEDSSSSSESDSESSSSTDSDSSSEEERKKKKKKNSKSKRSKHTKSKSKKSKSKKHKK
ncbi:peptidyl-prolyl cis-trans isomerase sig-7 [Stomoxys calcitrans]|uniref:peptidyl-prolyl cis-trans isomerase sig-7 n=1 Tax=Stomoxys calcitrans TaxID=35570 RepID=UPI0027E2BFEF|nr:peptidyl-prolyl cis-trans isomerase sig-7 [Stomoxys calcitrans]